MHSSPALDERTLAPSLSGGSSETLPGSAIGTPGYMSPEQAAGDLERLGPPSDVHGLGAILYTLLTGKPPFEGDDKGQVLQRVREGAFPPPRKLDRSIDPATEAICLRAMALEPRARYPSARALADDVERWMADEPVSARPDPWSARAARRVRRHRTLATGIGVFLIVAVVASTAGTVLINAQRAEADRQRTEAVQQRAEAHRQRTEADRRRAEAVHERARAESNLARARQVVEEMYTQVAR